MSPYRPYPHVVIEKHWKVPPLLSVLALALALSALVGILFTTLGLSRSAPLPCHELGGGWTQTIERNASGDEDYVLRGPRGTEALRLREPPPMHESPPSQSRGGYPGGYPAGTFQVTLQIP